MVPEEKVNKDFIADLVARTHFNQVLLSKDYYLTKILFAIRDVKGIYFKGGTALNKIFLDHARLSEDIDFTLSENVRKKQEELTKILKKQAFITKISEDKSVDGFIRMVNHYKNFSGEEDTIFIDLNQRGKLLTKPENHSVPHFYPDIPQFTIQTLSQEEMVAEKVAAAIGRNRPRDHYDIYQIIKHDLPINMKLVGKKCKDSGDEFSIIKMFNKAKKLKNRWEEDMIPLLPKPESFEEIIKFLAQHFHLKEAKEKQKDNK
ncbi:MAG: nucleotidyl transferase AbiEii/AbiGii toxin family protein [Nanoarchaeota archaeon]|nr:nucleotidyl transferase AbiEii/AbiGii toxin family protein [Nanoarchaeota archaeon]